MLRDGIRRPLGMRRRIASTLNTVRDIRLGWLTMHEQDGRDDHRDLSPVIPFRESSGRSETTERSGSPTERSEARICPWCGSRDTTFVQRGLIGPTDERDQYFSCRDCRRMTLEIVSRTMRDVRVGKFQVGGVYRDSARQAKYRISRVLKVGVNEVLLYLKPIVRREMSAPESD